MAGTLTRARFTTVENLAKVFMNARVLRLQMQHTGIHKNLPCPIFNRSLMFHRTITGQNARPEFVRRVLRSDARSSHVPRRARSHSTAPALTRTGDRKRDSGRSRRVL